MSKAPEHISQQELESYLWGAANAAARPDRRRRLQAVRLPPAVLQAPLRRVGRGVPGGARRDRRTTRLRPRDRRTTASQIPDGRALADVRAASTRRRPGAAQRVPRHRDGEPRAPLRHLRQRAVDGQGAAARRDAQEPDRALLQAHAQPRAVPEDELGNGYEYLIKKFADDSGHTAQEFYTNRTLVHLMTQMLEPAAGRVASTTRPAAPAAC